MAKTKDMRDFDIKKDVRLESLFVNATQHDAAAI